MTTQPLPLSSGAQGHEVELLHQELALFGIAVPQEEARAALFGPGTCEAVIKLQTALGLEPTGTADGATVAALHRAVEQTRPRSITGRVLHADGMPAEQISVKLVRNQLAGETVVASAPTGPDGAYALTYTLKELDCADAAQLTLRVLAVDERGAEVASSPPIYALQIDETYELHLDDQANLRSQYSRLRRAIGPALAGTRLVTLPSEQIAHLARVAGIDAGRARLLAENEREAHALALPEETLYLLRAAEIVPSGEALLASRSRQLAQMIAQRQDAGRIDEGTAETLTAFVTGQLPDLQAGRLLRPAEAGQPPSLGDQLTTIPPRFAVNDAQARAFARATLAQDADQRDLWELARQEGVEPQALATLKVTRELHELTGFHPALMTALHERRRDGDDSLAFLACLSPREWAVAAYTHGAPAGSPLGEAQYARQLQAGMEARYPAQMFASRLAAEGARLKGLPGPAITSFLAQHPEFDLSAHQVEPFLQERGLAGDGALLTGLQEAQRLLALTPHWSEQTCLLERGLGSPARIARLGPETFCAQVAGTIDPSRAKHIHAQASELSANALMVAMSSPSRLQPSSTEVLPTPDAAALAAIRERYPSLSTLFGDLSSCESQHCASVLSPAAYLVDLLHFLDSLPARGEGSALDVLLQRRPDLALLDLSCENTETEIPYVDLILELLEQPVGLPALIELPGDLNVASAFAAGLVPPAVVEALAKTASPLGPQLTVTRAERQPTAVGDVARGAVDWKLTDGARTWWLRSWPRGVLVDTGLEGPSLKQGDDANHLVEALERNAIDGSLGRALAPEAALPLGGEPPVVRKAANGWSVRSTRAATLTLTPGNPLGRVQLRTAQGTVIDEQHPTTVLQRITADLEQHVTTGALRDLLDLPPVEYAVTQKAPGQWELHAVAQAQITPVSGRLELRGIAFQSSSSQQDLLAHPENRNGFTYDRLRGQVYPWSLPYDLWLDETRTFLEQLGVPRAALLRLAKPQAYRAERAFVLEQLGLSDAEATLITHEDLVTPWAHWGLTQNGNNILDQIAGEQRTGTWLEIIARGSMFLQQSGLSFNATAMLFDTEYIRALKPGLGLVPPSACEPGTMVLGPLTSPNSVGRLEPRHLDRVHRFIRLWRRLRWPMHDLDYAVTTLSTDAALPLDDRLLTCLALVQELSAQLRVPPRQIGSWVGKLDAHDYVDLTRKGAPTIRSPYATLFLNPALPHASADDFALDEAGRELAYLTASPHVEPKRISAVIEDVAAALGVKAEDISLLLNGAEHKDARITDALTLANLSALVGAITLSRSLRVSIQGYIRLCAIVGLVPFDTVGTARSPEEQLRTLADFVERVAFIGQSGLSLEELAYVLCHRIEPGTRFARLGDEHTQLLKELRGALGSSYEQHEPTVDNLETQLMRLGWPQGLATAVSRLITYPFEAGPIEVPAGTWELPLLLRLKFVYKPAGRLREPATLSCRGLVSDQDFAVLMRQAPASYTRSIAALQRQYKAALTTHIEELGLLTQAFMPPTFEVGVDGNGTALPADVLTSLNMLDRLTLSKDGHRLVLHGWLTRSEQETVLRAVGDAALQKALGQLFELASAYRPTADQVFMRRLDAAYLLEEQPRLSDRLTFMLRRLATYALRDQVAAHLSEASELTAPVVAHLVGPLASTRTQTDLDALCDSSFVAGDAAITPETFPDQYAALTRLQKAGLLLRGRKPDLEMVGLLTGGAFDVLDLAQLPMSKQPATSAFEAWRNLLLLFRLRDALPEGGKALTALAAALGKQPFSLAEVQAVVASALSPTAPQLDDVAQACAPELLAMVEGDYRIPRRLLELAALLHVLRQMGASAAMARMLIRPDPDAETAQLARRLHKAQYTTEQWLEQLKPIENQLRERRRDAVAAHLVARYNLRDRDDLLDFYLIDAGMGACLRTSRIRQALSAVQLFVQRCLFNLEERVPPEVIDAQQWSWVKSYRVWEANRKVFLYPENWIEPELRDDKSEIFRALESDLQQRELTHATALDAVRGYLDRLSDIAHLTVVAAFEEASGDQQVKHIVARTQEQPYKHYYRSLQLDTRGKGFWTPWEEIKLSLGDHVTMFRVQGLLHIVWAAITPASVVSSPWKVQLHWARRTAEGWADQKKSRETITHLVPEGKDEHTAFALTADAPATSEAARVRLWGARDPHAPGIPVLREVAIENQFFDPSKLQLALRVVGCIYGRWTDPEDSKHIEIRTLEGIRVKLLIETIESIKLPLAMRVSAQDGSFELHVALSEMATINLAYASNWFVSVEYSDPNIKPTEAELSFKLPKNNLNAPQPSQLSNRQTVYFQDYLREQDIILDLKQRPFGTPDRDRIVDLEQLGTFEFRPDGGVTAVIATTRPQEAASTSESTGSSVAASINPLATHLDREYYDSGARERRPNSMDDSFSLAPGSRPLWTTSPGHYLLTSATSACSIVPGLYAYKDDAAQLLILLQGLRGYLLLADGYDYAAQIRHEAYRHPIEDALGPRAQCSCAPPTLSLAEGVAADATVRLDRAVDFDPIMPYSVYNWELFFHVPLLVATQLSKNQRFEEAQRWFHLIFDPTTNSPASADRQRNARRYWKFKPFQDAVGDPSIEALLEMLAQPDTQPGEDTDLSAKIAYWRQNPFKPHAIARARTRSYQFAVVLKYLDNLIAWADQLFRRYTMESLNEATQLYILAARLLGRRPLSIRPRKRRPAASYIELSDANPIDAFGNVWIGAQGHSAGAATSSKSVAGGLISLESLYFAVPPNEKLSEYWDTVEDRLFKIRHCMNIEGIEGQPPLFEPPIDPALLVRAAAAGVDIASVLADLSAPLPRYRFSVMLQKASELCAEVKSLGAALLAALEKRDAERLALLRSELEIDLLKEIEHVRRQQIDEAAANLVALRRTRQITAEKYRHYQRLLGKTDIPGLEEGAPIPLETLPLKLAALQDAPGVERGLALLQTELEHLVWLDTAHGFSTIASTHNTIAGVLHAMPDITIGGPPAVQVKLGGSHYGQATSAIASVFSMLAASANHFAARANILSGYERRRLEWVLQSNTAAGELEQIDKQIVAAEIRHAIAEQELKNHEQQLENARAVDELMREKYTNQQLYEWMAGQIAGVYFRTYQLAYDGARRAERAYRFELGLVDSGFIQPGAWDSLKKGLLAGERLALDLKRMEAAYLERNQREYELTKHVSLLRLDPLALIQLKETGACEIALPEALFDKDYPGHYMRRIKSVSLTIPCVVGPYTSINCTLTLLTSTVRPQSIVVGEDYGDATNYRTDLGSQQSVATSHAQNDSGLFELNFRDERYLPFEGAGAISTWRIEMPRECNAFDMDTITDVILHLKYTAREGGKALQAKLRSYYDTAAGQVAGQPLTRSFSARQEFPDAWYQFQRSDGLQRALELDLRERFPFHLPGKQITIARMDVFIKAKESNEDTDESISVSLVAQVAGPGDSTETSEQATFRRRKDLNNLLQATLPVSQEGGTLLPIGDPAKRPGVWKLIFKGKLNTGTLEDIVVIYSYTVNSSVS